jgi:hypothetical protein
MAHLTNGGLVYVGEATEMKESNFLEEGHREGERITIPGRRDQPCPWTLVSLSHINV